jgi:hypothetical protein
MNNTNDVATWWPRIGVDLDAAMSGAEDVLEDLSDPAADLDSPGAGGMEAADYALPPGVYTRFSQSCRGATSSRP